MICLYLVRDGKSTIKLTKNKIDMNTQKIKNNPFLMYNSIQ